MPTDRPRDPEPPDHNHPDPAHPAESDSARIDPTQPVPEHHPLPPYPEDDTDHPGLERYPVTPNPDEAAAAGSSSPGHPGGHEPTLALPSESDFSAGGSGEQPGGPQPTLPLPANFEAGAGGEQPGPHPLAGEFHGGAGPYGEPEVGVSTPPTFDLPVPSLEPEAPPLPAIAVPPRRGSMTTQEAGVTQPRPPTVAEARAREKARKRAEEQARAEAEAAEAKRRKKKRVLIGGAAVVGIAALVGGGYLVAEAWNGPEVTAYCTVVAKNGEVVPIGNGQTVTATQDNQEITVPDNYCSDAEDHGNSGINPGFFFLAGHSYRYYYGGTGTIGHAPYGGSTTPPSGATVKTKSGTTIQRGGLGAKVHGKGGS
ncbi:hypothetical protein [Nocardia sp. CDC160]|uniref:hypothetical protein n=1 Tax=Nocardia sp. CDC160 TaxID=3112166 RepID=UPI002DBBBCAC|nr:hypothetical protein [Nocardia sp. CDC160]MEC3915064.1 hypothetical protein [Nocardia sp. CDC160]